MNPELWVRLSAAVSMNEQADDLLARSIDLLRKSDASDVLGFDTLAGAVSDARVTREIAGAGLLVAAKRVLWAHDQKEQPGGPPT